VQIHANAKLVPSTRLLLVQRVPRRTPARLVALIEQLRRLRMTSTRIAAELKMAVSTVGAVLRRLGLHRLSRLEPPEPPNRYERRRPGELLHLDIKKLGRFHRAGHRVTGRDAPGAHAGRGQGWDRMHVAIDDYSRVAYVEILEDERGETCAAFLTRAIAWFAERGVRVERVLTDNGSGYRSKLFAQTCARHQVRALRTRPYRPRTNGKAERFIQTLLRDRAYAARYETSDNAPWHSGPASTTTTTDDHTAPSTRDPRSHGYPPPDQRPWDLHLAICTDAQVPRFRTRNPVEPWPSSRGLV
jgi:transposase InsO family protein